MQGENYIAQKYIHQPFLIDELKFDLRIYVLITGVCPLRCFIYKGGMARFSTEKYQSPNEDNLHNMRMHLTNYAINKASENYIRNVDASKDNIGHKRSLESVLDLIDQMKNDGADLPTSE